MKNMFNSAWKKQTEWFLSDKIVAILTILVMSLNLLNLNTYLAPVNSLKYEHSFPIWRLLSRCELEAFTWHDIWRHPTRRTSHWCRSVSLGVVRLHCFSSRDWINFLSFSQLKVCSQTSAKLFSAKVSFRPTVYKCVRTKLSQIYLSLFLTFKWL